MTAGLWAGAVGLLVATGYLLALTARDAFASSDAGVAQPSPAVEPAPLLPVEPDRMTATLDIRRGATLGTLLGAFDLPVGPIREAALPHHDLADIRPDRDLELVWEDGEQAPVALRYRVDEDHTVVVEREGDAWVGRMEAVAYEATTATRHVELTRSLWQDGLAAGLRPGDLATLAAIFEYEVDFNTELQSGAQLDLVAEVLEAEGVKPKLGTVHAIRLANPGAEAVVAVRFPDPDDPERDQWYRPDGTSLRKPFLRSPLEFSRVTSGFNPRRYHPVLKTPRPHNGTDFGAPTGTPIRAVADGRVVSAGRHGGHGNFVKLDHEGPYATSYSHMHRIRVRKGAWVKQGQIIGTVGTTGLSTGPHLHFQMWKNGRFVDAMRVDLPNQAPLKKAHRPAFMALVDEWTPWLDGPR